MVRRRNKALQIKALKIGILKEFKGFIGYSVS
jgi:hypothetical protein